MTPKILVLGKSGQLARAFAAVLGPKAVFLSRRDLDLAEPTNLLETLDSHKPQLVINTAAYTDVARAEQEEALARQVNGATPGLLAKACAERDIPLVHYSTDYVFADDPRHPDRPHTEEDPTQALNAYGRSKLEGEVRIAKAGGKYLIFRTSWVYDADGKNFVNTMLRFGKERDELTVVADQFGAPTYAPHLAKASWEICQLALAMPSFPTGIYNLCNAGETTWHGFAEEIFNLIRRSGQMLQVRNVKPISTAEYGNPVARPLNSRLSLNKIGRVFGVSMPDWRDGLLDCLGVKLQKR